MKNLIAVIVMTAILNALTVGVGGCAEERMASSTAEPPHGEAIATFAGGCFWGIERLFEKLPGVTEAVSGYTGGDTPNPTYKEVCSGKTHHVEAVQVHYDPSRISYEELLAAFWQRVDPADDGRSASGRMGQYRKAIFYHTTEQRNAAERARDRLQASRGKARPVATPILPAKSFYRAEAYHQDFHKKREGIQPETCAVPQSISFRKPDDKTLRKNLTPLQYRVTQHEGTEPPFHNAYWNNEQSGIYVDVVSGEPLFSSTDKFKSGTGWPSFVQPLVRDNVEEKSDRSLFMTRTEVRSAHGDSHLGHVFQDGPAPTGLRYCINSAALRFIPAANLEKEGYGEFAHLFEGGKQ